MRAALCMFGLHVPPYRSAVSPQEAPTSGGRVLMPTPYTPVFPAELAGRADASLVCIASGQHFGRLRDLVVYRGDRFIYYPISGC